MADDHEVIENDDLEEDVADDDVTEDEDFEADALDEDAVVDDDLPADDLEDDEDEEAAATPASTRKGADVDDEDDEDEADPDDVEEDLDTILRDRITAGAEDDDEDDEEALVDVRSEGGDRVAPRAAEEFSCPECFLLVRSSQFSSKRTDCPGGLDGEDCPMMKQFA